MIFEISCSIFKKKHFFLQFPLFQNSHFWVILIFWLKTPPNYKSCLKHGQNHQFALLSFTFHKKNPLFDVDLFSRPFDMESPYCSLDHVYFLALPQQSSLLGLYGPILLHLLGNTGKYTPAARPIRRINSSNMVLPGRTYWKYNL